MLPERVSAGRGGSHMRVSGGDGDFEARAIAGTHTVLIALDCLEARRKGLKGFALLGARSTLMPLRAPSRDRLAEFVPNTPCTPVALMEPVGIARVNDAVERMSFDLMKLPHQI